MLHLVYAAHGSDADFQRIEADLEAVAAACPRLVLVLEDVLAVHLLYQCLDPALQLPPEVLFDPRTVGRNREELARAYAHAMREVDRVYRLWNDAAAERKHTIFAETTSFNRRLLAWAAAHGVELVHGEMSFEAWLTQMRYFVCLHVATADAATVWAENRREHELLARAVQLRDADSNAQFTRLLQVERRGHDVLYVVGALHSVTENVLVSGLEAVVHERRFFDPIEERFVAALIANTLDALPDAERERIETTAFLRHRLQMLRRPGASIDDIGALVEKIDGIATARNVTLRQIADCMLITSTFQNAARGLNAGALRRMLAVEFVNCVMAAGFLSRVEVEQYLSMEG